MSLPIPRIQWFYDSDICFKSCQACLLTLMTSYWAQLHFHALDCMAGSHTMCWRWSLFQNNSWILPWNWPEKADQPEIQTWHMLTVCATGIALHCCAWDHMLTYILYKYNHRGRYLLPEKLQNPEMMETVTKAFLNVGFTWSWAKTLLKQNCALCFLTYRSKIQKNSDLVFKSSKSDDTFGWSILELSYMVNIYCQD